jgi:hypothetical protein
MATRRQFLREGITVSALSLMLGKPLVTASTAKNLPISKVVFDRNFAASRAFAVEATRLGVPVHGIAGDVTALWYEDLDQRWRLGPDVIAGLTGVSSLFCLEQLSRRDDRRVLLRIDHRPEGAGVIEHRGRGAAVTLARAGRMLRNAPWPAEMAQLLLSQPLNVGARVDTRSFSQLGSSGPVDDWVEPLVSWVIGPRPA